jgi:DNA-binding transcriptional LysR family regulator
VTLEQLRIFVAVAERDHVTRAANALNITQSAVSGSIAALETRHDVKLFNRVGRRVELTDIGRKFLPEAREVLDRAASAQQVLEDFDGLRGGHLRVVGSQTVAAYWLPQRLAEFHQRYPTIDLTVSIANTEDAVHRVLTGDAELGFVEGEVDQLALTRWPIGTDQMLLVGTQPVEHITDTWLKAAPMIVREQGSGTRSTFEQVLRARGIDPRQLNVQLTLPSNEAVLAAVSAGVGYAVLSQLVVASAVKAQTLFEMPIKLPARPFFALRQKERFRSKAADALLEIVSSYVPQCGIEPRRVTTERDA